MEPADYIPLSSDAHAFINGTLSAEQERDFERRMSADGELKHRVAEVQAARKLLSDVAMVDPPADFDDKLRARIRRVEMARSALAGVRQAPMALWQRAAMVGGGAIAAALVFAVVGMPGVLPRPAANPDTALRFDGGPALEVAEGDILAVVCDHYHRYREVSRQLAFAGGLDGDAQRELLSAELRSSELSARAQRLSTICAGLPAEQRREYLRFLDSLSAACESIDAELVASRNEGRGPDLAMIGETFAGIAVPERIEKEANLRVVYTGPASGLRGGVAPLSAGGNAELDLYSRAREAFYARDYAQSGRLFDNYLATYSGGKFRDGALASGLAAHVRAGEIARAVDLEKQIRLVNASLLKRMDAADIDALARAIADRKAIDG
ncbi:MAG: hypothetical protein IT462_12795 [Planctomycetes bacterium]|nr:hypothetical protein [Planctomycetota bacterium]